MKLFEAINFNRETLNRLISAGFKPDDCKYLDLYAEYVEMRREGGKTTWAVASLSEKYAVSERKVYNIIKHFETDCTAGAVQ